MFTASRTTQVPNLLSCSCCHAVVSRHVDVTVGHVKHVGRRSVTNAGHDGWSVTSVTVKKLGHVGQSRWSRRSVTRWLTAHAQSQRQQHVPPFARQSMPSLCRIVRCVAHHRPRCCLHDHAVHTEHCCAMVEPRVLPMLLARVALALVERRCSTPAAYGHALWPEHAGRHVVVADVAVNWLHRPSSSWSSSSIVVGVRVVVVRIVLPIVVGVTR